MNTNRFGLLAAMLFFIGSASATDALSFNEADENGDGFVSKLEIKHSPKNESNWEKADANKDGKLDTSEFSAFESMEVNQSSDTSNSSSAETK